MASMESDVERAVTVSRPSPNSNNTAVTLPTEIIARFLELGLPHKSQSPFALQPDAKYLRTITTVCQRWREVAMGTPRLWSRIRCKPDVKPIEAPIKDVTRRLMLAKQSPLSVDIGVKDAQKFVVTSESPFVSLLAPHFPRIKHLNIDITSNGPSLVHHLLEQGLPSLSILNLRIKQHADSQSVKAEVPSVVVPPTLKHVRFNVSGFEDEAIPDPYIKLASNATTLHVDLNRTHKPSLLKILEQTPNIEQLTLVEVTDDDNHWREQGAEKVVISLPKLKVMALTPRSSVALLKDLEMPVLETVTINRSNTLINNYGAFEALTGIRNLTATHVLNSFNIAKTVRYPKFHIETLEIALTLGDLIAFSRRLTQRESNEDGAYHQWPCLRSLILLVDADMLYWNSELGVNPIQYFVAAVVDRPDVTFTARLNHKMDAKLEGWIEMTEERLGDRFKWVLV